MSNKERISSLKKFIKDVTKLRNKSQKEVIKLDKQLVRLNSQLKKAMSK